MQLDAIRLRGRRNGGLLVVGVIALAAGITLVVVGIQAQKRASVGDAQPNTGQANPLFDNPGAPTPNGQPPLNWTGLTAC